MKRSGPLSLLVVGLAAGAGCLLTTPLDGFDGPGGGGGSDTGAGGEVGLDGPGGDAGPQADGPSDAPIDQAEAAVDFRCSSLAQVPAFCTDFDMGTLASIVGSPNTILGGQVTLDETVFRSSSRSVKFTSPSITGTMGRANFARSFGFTPQSSIRVELDLRIDSIDTSSTNTITVSMGNYDLALFLGGSAKLRQGVPGDGGTVFSSTNLLGSPVKAWVHVSLAIAIVNGSSTATVAYDGVPQSSVPLVIDQYRMGAWQVAVGLNFISGPDNGRELHVDNLVIDGN